MQATIDRSSGFKRQHRAGLFDALRTVLVALETDQPLEAPTATMSFPEIGLAIESATSSLTCC